MRIRALPEWYLNDGSDSPERESSYLFERLPPILRKKSPNPTPDYSEAS
jgi:hypothetical protein